MTNPIKPSEVAGAKGLSLPSDVIAAFNELIVENFRHGSAVVTKNAVLKRILAKMPDVTATQVYERGWLDVEPVFREAGWRVVYDKPAYNETYEASFRFTGDLPDLG